MTSTLPFALVDVFASTPLSGNPLAVVLDADELSDGQMQRVAGEFNQPETTFVLRPRRPGATRRLRSFTAAGSEVVGAGHNALGAWWWLVESGVVEAGALQQELGDEVLPVSVERHRDRLDVAMRQAAPVPGAEVAARDFAAALGLPADAFAGGVRGRVVSTGSPHLLLPARDRAIVDAAAPDSAVLRESLAGCAAQGCYLFAVSGDRAYARFFNPTVGLWEDPATGSAAGPLAWWLTRDTPGPATLTVEQGHALGRPSELYVEVDGAAVTLHGAAALAAEGRLHVAG
jgi:trans-2,3-dihydro-3-hydroxyanthranilate isomerase